MIDVFNRPQRFPSHLFLLAVVLAAAAAVSPVAAEEAPRTAFLADIATDATDPNNLADTEPSIAVNPRKPWEIAVVAFSERWDPNNPAVMAPVWKSRDGGRTWRKVFQIPRPQPGLGGPGDQKIAFDAGGRLHVAELGSGGGLLKDFIYRQTGGPDDPLTAGAAYGDDQPHLEIDVSPASPFLHRLYSPWLNFGVAPERSAVSNSPDRGVTMNDVGVGDNSLFPNRTTRAAVSPLGQAYAIYKTREGAVGGGFEKAHFRVSRSDDGGATWNALGPGGARPGRDVLQVS